MNRIIQVGLVSMGMAAAVCGMSRSVTQKEASAIVDVADYGTVADGNTLNTKMLQAAIDACEPGGQVYVGPGSYVTGTLWLKSDMEFHVAEGAELLGSLNLDDYSRENQGAVEAPVFDECVLYAENVKNVKLTGGGTINGRGHSKYFPERKPDGSLADRPMLIRFVDSQHILFEGITLKNAASWCTHFVSCNDIEARKVTIDSHVNKNNDGFDLDGCNNVLIEDCNIQSGDDAICPKSTTDKVSENMVVRNCRVKSHTAAFKCGTSSRAGFRNITIEACDFSGCRMGVIKLLTVDGGVLENIKINNVVMNDVEGPLFIRLGNRGRTYDTPTEQIYGKDVKSEGAPPGVVKNIHISNIKATVVGDDQKRNGIMISGIPGHTIKNVVLENIEISFPGGGTQEDAAREVAEDVARYPEQFFFGTLPAWGAYIRHAENITFKNVKMSTRSPDARKKKVLVDVKGFKEL